MTRKIYLDHAAATPIDPRAERIVLKCMKMFGNPSSLHEAGRQAKEVLEDSRRRVAKVLNCRPEEIVFTGSGTESVNLAVFGVARAYKLLRGSLLRGSASKLGGHIVTTKIEHHAVLRTCEHLEKYEGFEVTYLDAKTTETQKGRKTRNREGTIDPAQLKKALRPDTILVSVMYANNEIGTIQPISEISKLIRNFRNQKSEARDSKSEIPSEKFPVFHTDACQAAGALSLNVNQLGVDLMTLNGSKIYGPKGVGCFYVRRGTELVSMIVGGNQERGLRAGTENVPAIAGFAGALEIADTEKTKENARLIKLRDYLIKNILDKIPGSRLNGDPVLRLPNNVNISFENVDGEMLVLALDQKGIQVSTGAACTTTETGPVVEIQNTRAEGVGKAESNLNFHYGAGPSHVLQAIKSPALSQKGLGNVRITLGRQTTKKDIDYIPRVLSQVIQKMRRFR